MTDYKLTLTESLVFEHETDLIIIETTKEIFDNAIKALERDFENKTSLEKIDKNFRTNYPVFNSLWNIFSPKIKKGIQYYLLYCLLKGCNPVKIDNVNLTLNFNKNDINQIINSPEFQKIIQNQQNYNFELHHDKTK